MSALAGVALAAGRGVRMRPLTDALPKVLMPVAGVPLLDLALDRLVAEVGSGPRQVAVNAHHHAGQVLDAVAGRAHASWERPQALGTAGALGRLREWLDGRHALVTNADVYHPGPLAELVEGWDGERCRLLVVPAEAGRRHDLTRDGVGLRYVGSCLLPWTAVRGLAAEPTGLYEVLWRDAEAAGSLDLVRSNGISVDCGTPADYLAANLHATRGASAVHQGATVQGRVDRCVVWDGAWVGPDEDLREVIRAGSREHPLTVPAEQPTG